MADRSEDGMLIAFSGRGEAPPDEPSATAHLARLFAAALGHESLPIARATQVHGTAVLEANAAPAGATVLLGEGDILMTARPGVGLVVQTADCVPILLVSDKAVAAIHAGWRGTALGAARAAVRELRARYGVEPDSLRAHIGPAIGLCCYEVGGEVAAQFAGDFLRRPCGGKFRLDLKAAIRAQLEAEGILSESIQTVPLCTMCGGETLASYRRDGRNAGRMIAMVARL
ncbi:MAG: peptidoglycan editing factor PgeF [Thermoanaerobaculia bacterium]